MLELFNKCISASYTQVDNDGDYAIQKIGDTLFLYFQWSNSKADWINNFDFPATPYNDMGDKWYCHRGFLRVWKSIKPYVKDQIMDPEIKRIVTVGYSHGAAIAGLAYEYIWYHREDLRDSISGFAFGCPRFFFSSNKKIRERWANFKVIRNNNDIVTHLPPAIFGFHHVGKLIRLKNKYYVDKSAWLNCINDHMDQNYRNSLENFDQEKN